MTTNVRFAGVFSLGFRFIFYFVVLTAKVQVSHAGPYLIDLYFYTRRLYLAVS